MKLKCSIDGDQLCITGDNFTNLQESPAVFVSASSETGRAIQGLLNSGDSDEFRSVPTAPHFKIGATIKNKYTGERKTIERTKIVGAAHLVYIATDGTRYDTRTLCAHWTVVQPPATPPPTT